MSNEIRTVREIRAVTIGNVILATENAAAGVFKVKVGQCDSITAGGMVYPRSVWESQVARLAAALAKGKSDTQSESPLRCYRLEIANDGCVFAHCELKKNHRDAHSFLSAVSCGAAIAFEVKGTASAHSPGRTEIDKYGLHRESGCVIIDANYELHAITPVYASEESDEALQLSGGITDIAAHAALERWSAQTKDRSMSYDAPKPTTRELEEAQATLDHYISARHAAAA